MIPKKASIVFLILVVAISATGLTYALWSDTIEIRGTIQMAKFGIKIISHKALLSKCVERYSTLESQISPDGQFLNLEASNLRPSWYTWVGLKIQNDGNLPADIKLIEYIFEPYVFNEYFSVEEYFYGPFPPNESPSNPINQVWKDVKIGEELDSDGDVHFPIPDVPTPVSTDSEEKVIVWIWIHCEEDVPEDLQGQVATLKIRIVDDLGI